MKNINDKINSQNSLPQANSGKESLPTNTVVINDALPDISITNNTVNNEPKSIPETEDAGEVIKRLSQLSIIEYQKCRLVEAKKIGFTAGALDMLVKKESAANTDTFSTTNGMFPEVTPWHEPVDGCYLLESIANTIKRFTVLSDEQIYTVAIWIMLTWVHSHATVSPILNISSPEKRCGKSTLLSVLMKLCYQQLVASNISPAAVYRAIEKWQPTLMIDEADTFMARSEDLRGILNAGHYKNTAFVIRCEGEDNEPVSFSTWCAKVVAGIGNLPETVMDRSVIIEMHRKLPEQEIESIRHAEENLFEELCRKLARWAQDNASNFKQYKPKRIDGINDRANDNWEPLFTLANMVGGQWPERITTASIKLSGTEEEEPTIGEQLLNDTLEAFNTLNGVSDRLPTAELISALCNDPEKPWSTWNRGNELTAIQLSKKLKPFRIRPVDIRFSHGVKKGYYQADFKDAVSRYTQQQPATEATIATAKPAEISRPT